MLSLSRFVALAAPLANPKSIQREDLLKKIQASKSITSPFREISTLQEAERIEDLKETVVGRASRSQQQLEERLRASWRRLCGTWRVEGTHGNPPPMPSPRPEKVVSAAKS